MSTLTGYDEVYFNTLTGVNEAANGTYQQFLGMTFNSDGNHGSYSADLGNSGMSKVTVATHDHLHLAAGAGQVHID